MTALLLMLTMPVSLLWEQEFVAAILKGVIEHDLAIYAELENEEQNKVKVETMEQYMTCPNMRQ